MDVSSQCHESGRSSAMSTNCPFSIFFATFGESITPDMLAEVKAERVEDMGVVDELVQFLAAP